MSSRYAATAAAKHKSLKDFVNPDLTLPAPTTNVLQDAVDSDDEEEVVDDENCELWTLRLPIELPLSALNGMEINLKDWTSSDATVKDEKGNSYKVVPGEATETETLRVLLPGDSVEFQEETAVGSEDDEDDDDSIESGSGSGDGSGSDSDRDSDSGDSNMSMDSDGMIKSKSKSSQEKKENKKKEEKSSKKKTDHRESEKSSDEGNTDASNEDFLVPCPMAFARHFNVIKSFPQMSEMQLAPLKGPDPVDDPMRHAYAPIPQRKGLKRRWMPLGVPKVGATATVASSSAKKSKKHDKSSSSKSTKAAGKQKHHSSNHDGVIVSPAEDDDHDAHSQDGPSPPSSPDRKRKAEKRRKKDKKSKKHKKQKTVVEEA